MCQAAVGLVSCRPTGGWVNCRKYSDQDSMEIMKLSQETNWIKMIQMNFREFYHIGLSETHSTNTQKKHICGLFFSHEILTSLTSLPCDFPKLVSAYQFPTRKPAPSTASWPFMGSDRTAVGSDNDVGMQDVYWQDDPLEIHIRDFFWWTYLFLRKYSHTELCKRCFMDQKDIHFFGLWLLTLRVFTKHLSDNATDFDRTIHACNKLCTRRATP